jgi:hypothetical protein
LFFVFEKSKLRQTIPRQRHNNVLKPIFRADLPPLMSICSRSRLQGTDFPTWPNASI